MEVKQTAFDKIGKDAAGVADELYDTIVRGWGPECQEEPLSGAAAAALLPKLSELIHMAGNAMSEILEAQAKTKSKALHALTE